MTTFSPGRSKKSWGLWHKKAAEQGINNTFDSEYESVVIGQRDLVVLVLDRVAQDCPVVVFVQSGHPEAEAEL